MERHNHNLSLSLLVYLRQHGKDKTPILAITLISSLLLVTPHNSKLMCAIQCFAHKLGHNKEKTDQLLQKDRM